MIVSLFFSFLLQAQADTCQPGLAAFERTVYAKVRRDCAGCHSGVRPDAPAFASGDVKQSYEHLLNYMNFSQPQESLLVVRAGNGHCGEENCEIESGIEMAELAKSWWETGENSCQRNGRLFTAEINVPENLPAPAQGFSTLTFDLLAVDEKFRGVSFAIDVQEYLPKSAATKGALRFKSPRFVSEKQVSLRVKNIKILIDGAYDAVYNAYTTIDKSVSLRKVNTGYASPVLSGVHQVIMKNVLPRSKLSVSFVELESSQVTAACMNERGFKSKVSPVLNDLKCSECHNNSGKSFGESVLNLNSPESERCEVFSELVNSKNFMSSPAVSIPTRSYGQHPILSENDRLKYVGALKDWLDIK